MKNLFKDKVVLIGSIFSIFLICICPIAMPLIAATFAAINNYDDAAAENLGYQIAPVFFGIVCIGFVVLITTIILYFLRRNKAK